MSHLNASLNIIYLKGSTGGKHGEATLANRCKEGAE